MNATTVIAVAIIVLGGAMLAVQAPVNAGLARTLGNPLPAACISFGIGFLVLAIASTLRSAWPNSIATFGGAPWWSWTGGLLGAFYVAGVVWAVPKLGVVSTVAALVFGQLMAALALDATGAFGLAVQSISLTRVLAALLVLGGLVLSRAS